MFKPESVPPFQSAFTAAFELFLRVLKITRCTEMNTRCWNQRFWSMWILVLFCGWSRLALRDYEVRHFTKTCDPKHASVVMGDQTGIFRCIDAKIAMSSTSSLCGLRSWRANISATPEIAVPVRRDHTRQRYLPLKMFRLWSHQRADSWRVINMSLPGVNSRLYTLELSHCHRVSDNPIIFKP